MNKRLLTAPLFFVTLYLAFGLSVATFGPLRYQGFHPGMVALYIGQVVIMFGFGYMLGARLRIPKKTLWKRSHNQFILTVTFRTCLALAVLLLTYELFNFMQSGSLNFNLANSAAAYIDTYADYSRNSGSYGMRFLITSAGAFPLFVAQVLGIFYFKEIDRASKIAVIYLFVASIIVYTLGGGKQKQFGDIMIYVVSVVLAKQAATGRLRFRTVAIVGGAALFGVYVLLMLLAFRYQAIEVNLAELNQNLHPLIVYQDGYWLEWLLGEDLAFPFVMFSAYLGQGYFGLSLSFEQPFTWTCFAGSSYSISVILNQFFGADFWVTRNYPYLVGAATGWDQTKWHTVFAWLASDLTFTGVVFFMGVMGFIYGRAWREILIFQNPFAVMMFAMMNIGLVYAPANNQLMHSPGGLATSLGVFLFYFLFHSNFNASSAQIRRLKFSF